MHNGLLLSAGPNRDGLRIAAAVFGMLWLAASVKAQPLYHDLQQSTSPTNWPAATYQAQPGLSETNVTSEPSPQPQSPFMTLTNLGAAAGASVVPSSAASPTLSSGPALAGTSQLSAPPVALAPGTTSQGLAQLGPIQLHAHLAYQISYGNSLQSAPGQQADTLINQISPGIFLQLGKHWTLDYTPTLFFYSNNQFRNVTDQSVVLTGGTTYGDWTFGLSQAFALTEDPLIETGAQTEQQLYSTLLSAVWQMNSKMSLQLGASQVFRLVGQPVAGESLGDVYSWSTTDWLNYKIAPHLSVGLGLAVGYDDVTIGSDDVFEQILGSISWQAGNKLSFFLSGGLDYRQFLNSGIPNMLNPVYTLAIQYQLFEPTTLSLSGSSTIVPSYYGGSSSEIVSLSAGLHQRLLRRLFLNVTGGYSTTTYSATTTNLPGAPTSGYTTTTVNVSVSTTFLRRGTASAFYAVNFNSSGAALYNYTTSQVGLSLAYGF